MNFILTDHKIKPPSMLYYLIFIPLITSINKPESENGIFLEQKSRPFKF